MRFLNFLNEVKFKDSFDVDWSYGNKIIVFDKDFKYKREGKTHGLKSHALKHLKEFRPSLYQSILSSFIEELKSTDMDMYIFNSNNELIATNENAKKMLDISIAANTLDYFNDKLKLKKKIKVPKNLFEKYISQLEEAYEKIIQRIRTNSISIDNMSYREILDKIKTGITIRFKGMQKSDTFIFYVNFDNGTFMIEDTSSVVNTLYIITGSIKRKLKRKGIKPLNKDIKKIWS